MPVWQDGIDHGIDQQHRQGVQRISVFAGVGERTCENDLLREMIESGVIKYGKEFEESMEAGGWDLTKVDTNELAQSQATLVFGQMNESPGARARGVVRFDGCEYFRDGDEESEAVTFCSSLTTSSDSRRRVLRYQPSSVVCHRR